MKLVDKAKALNNFKNDPFGFIVDTIVRIIVNLIIPIPLAGDLAVQFKGPIVGCVVTLVFLGIFMIVSIGLVILMPFLATENFIKNFTAPFTQSTANIAVDTSFIQTDTPTQIPLGGHGLEYAIVTAGFMDPAYFLQFGKNHTGIDLVPNNTYFTNSESYKKNQQIVAYATTTGTTKYYVDGYGGLTVETINQTGTIKTIEIHMKQVFVKTGDQVQAGTPIGIMGMTGDATGEHVHYEIQTKQGNTWISVNPLMYIK